MSSRRQLRFSIGPLILFASIGLVGQDRLPTIRVDVPLVSMDVAVFDSAGRPITNMTRDDFRIFDEGEQTELKAFSSVETPYNILALFDCTGSTREAWPFLFKSLNEFLGALRPQDRVAVLAFGGGTATIRNWTSRSTDPLNVQMLTPFPLCDQTDFYGALVSAARKMREVSGRKGVIVFTDGVHGGIPAKPAQVGGRTVARFVDSSEDPGFLAVRRTIEGGDVVFYFIAVNTDVSPSNVDAGNLFPGTQYTPLSLFNLQQVRSRMELIAQISGGRIVFSQRNSDTGMLFEQIVRELGTSYSLAFTPTNARDGKFHRIEVRVPGREIQVRQSRDGYYAR